MQRSLVVVLALSLLTGGLLLSQEARSADVQFKAAQYKEQVDGDLRGAIVEYQKLVGGKDRPLAAQALLRIADLHRRLGDTAAASDVYQRLIRDFADQTTAVSFARTRLTPVTPPAPAATTTPVAPAQVQPRTQAVVVSADRLMDIAVFNRKGTLLRRISETAPITIVSLSPDGQRIAYSPSDGRLMVLDVASGMRMQIGEGTSPVGWSPDGSRIMHYLRRDGQPAIYTTSAYGPGQEELMLRGPNGIYHWTVDGQFLVVGLGPDFVAVPVAPGSHTPIPILSQQLASGPRVSPDNRFVAYTSTTSSPREIRVRPLSLAGSRLEAGSVSEWRASNGAALGMTRWRNDGGELYYIGADGAVMAVPVSVAGEFVAGTPVRLFRTPPEFPLNNIVGQHADVSGDGERFVFLLASAN